MICSRTGRGRSWAGAWLSVVLVVVATAAGLQVRADAAVTPQVRTVCSYARQGLTLLAAHTAAPMWHYAHLFNGTAAAPLQWKMQLLLSSNDGVNISGRLVVQQWLAKGSGCSVLVGSGNADIDSRLVGLVDVPWLEPVLSTAAVVDRHEYPTMLNYLPEKSIAARQFLALLPSRYVSVLSSAHDSSRVWATAATAVFASTNVDVTTVRELTVACDAAAAAAAVQALLALRTRYIFVAVTPVQDAGCFTNVLQALVAAKATATHVLVFPDDACTLANVYLQSLPGSLCFDYDTTQGLGFGVANGTSNETAYRAAAAAYIPRLTTLFAGVGITFDSALYTTVRTYYGVLFHDAVVHYMQTAHAMPTRLPTAADLAGGAVTAIGITGALRFDADAVRRSIPIVIYNTLPPLITGGGLAVLQRRVVARVFSNGTFMPLAAEVYLLGEEHSMTALPTGLTPLPPAATSNTTLIVAVTAGGVILLLVGFAAIFGLRAAFAPDPRDNHQAPKDETQPFSIAFTDIQASTTLWAVAPQGMSEAVEQHHALVRELIADHKGYEVKTIGDSFMVAFQDAAAAVRFAVRLQGALYHAEWPADIDRAYEAMAAEAGLGAGATDAGLWSGLRVRVGVHHGSGSIVLDPTTKGYDYYGTVVNTAARVETVGNGGQVLVTAAALAAAGDDAVEDAVVAGLGAQQLRGLNDAVELHQVVPAEFDGRQFPPLRLDRIDDDDCQLALDPTADVRPSESVADGNTSSSQPSSRKKAAGGGRTDSGTDKGTGQGSGTSTVIDDPHTLFLRTVLSPLSVSDRGSVLATLVGKWHVNVGTAASARALSKPAISDKAIVAVATRAARALTALNHTALPGSQKDSTSRFGESTAETGEDRHAGSFRLGHHNYSGNSILRASQGRFGRAGTMRSGAYLAGQPSPDHPDLGRRDSQCSGGPSGGGTSGLGFGSALGSSAMMNIVLDGTGSNAVASATPMSLRSPNMENQRRGAQGAAFPGHLSASLTMQSASWGGDQVTSAGSSAVVSPSRGRGGAGDSNRGGRGQGSSPPLVGLSAPVGAAIPVGSDFGSAAQSFEIPGKTDSSGAGSSPATGPSPNPGHSTATDLPLPPLPPSHPGSSHDVTEQ